MSDTTHNETDVTNEGYAELCASIARLHELVCYGHNEYEMEHADQLLFGLHDRKTVADQKRAQLQSN